MPKLYIANLTKQIQDFLYVSPGVTPTKHVVVKIPIGEQARIHHDNSTMDDLQAILAQHEPYGLLPVSEVAKRGLAFSGMCYSFDKPVPMDKIQEGVLASDDFKEEVSARVRKESAVAASHFAESDSGAPGIGNLTMEAVEQVKSGDVPSVHETIEVGIRNSKSASVRRKH